MNNNQKKCLAELQKILVKARDVGLLDILNRHYSFTSDDTIDDFDFSRDC